MTPTTGAAPMMTTFHSEPEIRSDRARSRTLVIGSDGALTEPIVRALQERGREVSVVGASGFGKAVEWGGNARAIDFGLSGVKYEELISSTARLIVAVEPDRSRFRDPASSQHVRAAAEALEFVRAGGAPEGVTFLSSLLAFGTALGTVGEGDFNVGQGFASPLEESLALAEKIARRSRAYTACLGILRAAPIIGNSERGVLDRGSLFAEVVNLSKSGTLHSETIWTDKPFVFETGERVGARLEKMSSLCHDGVVHLFLRNAPTDREVFEWLTANRPSDPSRSGRLFGFLKRPAQVSLTSPERRAFGWALRFSRGHESDPTEGSEPAWTDLLKGLLDADASGLDPHE